MTKFHFNGVQDDVVGFYSSALAFEFYFMGGCVESGYGVC